MLTSGNYLATFTSISELWTGPTEKSPQRPAPHANSRATLSSSTHAQIMTSRGQPGHGRLELSVENRGTRTCRPALITSSH